MTRQKGNNSRKILKNLPVTPVFLAREKIPKVPVEKIYGREKSAKFRKTEGVKSQLCS